MLFGTPAHWPSIHHEKKSWYWLIYCVDTRLVRVQIAFYDQIGYFFFDICDTQHFYSFEILHNGFYNLCMLSSGIFGKAAYYDYG